MFFNALQFSKATAPICLTLLGIKVLCVLLPGIFVLGSWAAFKFVWNMSKEKREALTAFKQAQKEENKTNE